ncbi:alpha/beta fold hydrolase [Cumulibacter manganitolerans]|uniref:alpha/beta fold hydrolase n=1 Tax=Cumulibacter manganitolerans TaxID=1884992 RepID=UPI001295899E|nr:alpha/beta hydrolase [Cumulibacter manganitolerans]
MTFAIEQRSHTTDRHTTAYLQAGPDGGPLLIFCHGWPELSHSWRHVLPVLAGLGFRCVAPDMRGYGGSSVPEGTAAYAQEEIVADMIELIDHLGEQRAVWVGHDWGSPVVWNIAGHHPERTRAVASLVVPFQPRGFCLETLLDLVDRDLYPADEYPAGQWDYFLFYEESFEQAHADFERDVDATVRAVFRHGRPEHLTRPSINAMTRRSGGFFKGPVAPDLPLDERVLTEEDRQTYVRALSRNGFTGPDSWYVNDEANAAYSRAGSQRLEMPVLFLHGRYDAVCQTVRSRLADPMREACPRLSEHIVDSGHWMAQEKPVAVNAALAGWLAREVADWWPTPR